MNLLFCITTADKVAIFIAIGCFVLPVLVLSFIVCGKFLIKKIKQNREINAKKRYDNPKSGNDYYALFGGIDNISKITKELNRATIDVVDLGKVDFAQLKSLQIGVLVTGNQLKVSSPDIVKAIKEM